MKNNCFITLFALLSMVVCFSLKAQVSFSSNGQQLSSIAGGGVALGDFNRDGHLDAFIGNRNQLTQGGHKVYFNDGNGQFTDSGQSLIDSYDLGSQPFVGDINNDGIPEVLTGGTIWLNDGNGIFTVKSERLEGLDKCKLADLNNDGYLDVIGIIIPNKVKVYFNNSTGNFYDSGQTLVENEIGPQGALGSIALADINGDNAIDAIVGGWQDNNSSTPCSNRILINNGNGIFTVSSQLINEGSLHVHSLVLGDIDNDNDPDLIIGRQTSPNSVKIYINNGTGNFTYNNQTFGSHSAESIAMGDINGDGNPDLYLGCGGKQPPTLNEIWINDGEGQFSNSQLQLGSNWSSGIELGYLNGDSLPDAFVVNINYTNRLFNPAASEVWLNTTGTTSVNILQTSQINIFPNPVEGLFTITLESTPGLNAAAGIYNVNGEMVLQQTLNSSTSTIDLSSYPKGMYLVKVVAGNECYNEKIIKKK